MVMSNTAIQQMDVIHNMTTYTKKPVTSYSDCDRAYGDVVSKMDPHVVELPYKKHFPVGVPHKLVLATYNPVNGAKPNRFYDKRGRMCGGMPVNNPVSRTGVRAGACDETGCTGTYVTDGHGDHVCNVCGIIADMTAMNDDDETVDETVDFLVNDDDADFDRGTASDAYVGMVGGGAMPRKFGAAMERIADFEKSAGITRPYGQYNKRSAPPEHVVGMRVLADEHLLAMVLALVRDGVNTRANLVRALGFANVDARAVDRALETLAGDRKRARTGRIGAPRIVATRVNSRVVTYAVL